VLLCNSWLGELEKINEKGVIARELINSPCPDLIILTLEVKFKLIFFPFHVLVFNEVKMLIPFQSILFAGFMKLYL
jgi:hypothetical protein